MIFIVFINRYAYASTINNKEAREQIIEKLTTGKKLIFYKDSQALKKGNKSKNRKAFKENKFVQSIIKAVGHSNKKTINYQQINDNILEGIKRLEESIFFEFVKQCSLKEKLALALRLGYFNTRFYTSKEVASIIDIDENLVISLTEKCLKRVRNNYIEEKQKQLILI